MSWFWFTVAVLFLVWNVFLMRALSYAQKDVRRLRRRSQSTTGHNTVGGGPR